MKKLVVNEYNGQRWIDPIWYQPSKGVKPHELVLITAQEKVGQTHEISKNTEGRSYRVLSLVEERTDEIR